MNASAEYTVDFWLDPACPLTRLTARWLMSLRDNDSAPSLRVRWRMTSLSVLNEGREHDPEGDEHGYLWIPARAGAAVQAEHGHDALGAFYEALWTDRDGTEREWLDHPAAALRRAGLPAALAETGTGYDGALRASHRQAVDLVHGEVGTPILAITGPDGLLGACFGPVLSELPDAAGALSLWQGLCQLLAVAQFRELKR